MAEVISKATVKDPEALLAIQRYAKQNGISEDQAADKLVLVARNRINALRKHARKMAEQGELPKVKAAAKVTPAKKAKPAKKATPKAKAAPASVPEAPSAPMA